jgi:F-type H+-transporting ATPase subunit a
MGKWFNSLPVPVRGLVVLGIIVAVIGTCAWVSFGLLPSTGSAATLPVIVVPGEPYTEPAKTDALWWTNTMTAVVIADIFVLIFILLVRREGIKPVPGFWQSIAELFGGFMYTLSKNIAGPNARVVFPLVGSIFIFLLATNWMKLLPGIESVGVMHCAGHNMPHVGINITAGHPKVGDRLLVTQPLFAGYPADHHDYEACQAYKKGKFEKPSQEALDAAATELEVQEVRINNDATLALDADQRAAALAEARLAAAQTVWPDASVGLAPRDLRNKDAVPYLFVVTPYVRGATTDLNLTLGLALVSFFAIQFFGGWKLGLEYLYKFINIPALGNLQKKPLGAIDFIVGLIEIISEIGKIISLSFRLFGNMFAGGILLAVMSFLVTLLLPGVFILLEVIITTIQALVFAVLTLVFASQAMTSHHHDEEHGHAEGHGHDDQHGDAHGQADAHAKSH